MKLKIKNIYNETLDTLIEGNLKSNRTVVFVHGFGTNKNEGFDLFKDVASALKKDFKIARFDFSGYGKSRGKQEDVNISKQANDLSAVLKYVKNKYKGNIYIIAHSMGTSAVCSLNPAGIKKSIFTGIPTADSIVMARKLIKRIKAKKEKINFNGITFYKRTSGLTQKIGPKFWEALKKFNGIKEIKKLSRKSKVTIIHPKSDEIVGDKGMGKYKKLAKVNYLEIPGNHNFTKHSDRKNLIKIIKEILEV